MDSASIRKYILIYGRHRSKAQKFLLLGFFTYFICSTSRSLTPRTVPKPSSHLRNKHLSIPEKEDRVAVDAVFYARLSRILRIVIPSWRSKEALLLAMHSALLVFRTIISLYVAVLDGKIVASLVRAQPAAFLWNIIRWLLLAVPATATNSWLSYIQSKLSLAYRTRLTKELMTKYLGIDGDTDNVFYKMSNLDDRIKNVDQMLTVDIQRFSNHLAAVYSNLAKPVLDVVLYNYQLSQNVGAEGLILITVLIQASAALLRTLTPPFGAYTAREAAMSGALRHSQSRLVESADEVAFFSGEKTERMLIERDYFGLVKHVNHVLKMRLWHGTVEEGIIKWLWGSFGLGLCAIPVFFKVPGVEVSDLGGRTEGFVTNRRLLLSASDAVGRVMYSYKELSELAGYTARVSLLLDTITDVRGSVFNKTRIDGAHSDQLLLNRGRIIESDDIQFENVPIITPNGDVLVRSLSFHIKHGNNLLIVGPNGCGKSSLFRILGGLWPVYGEYHILYLANFSYFNLDTGGLVRKPPASDFILIPQRPYLCLGTLRDQIIYPHSKIEMKNRGITDDGLALILAVVEMDQVVDREGGWDVVRDWRDALSGGDKQKIAWARLFYHRPKYSVLDEATSHIPQDLEMRMMEHAMSLGISLLTVSHRPSLWQYHSHILQYDGAGGYVFTTLNAKQRLALQEEKQGLETKLLGVPKIRARLENLRNALDERQPPST